VTGNLFAPALLLSSLSLSHSLSLSLSLPPSLSLYLSIYLSISLSLSLSLLAVLKIQGSIIQVFRIDVPPG
jgi:hypothetical protein